MRRVDDGACGWVGRTKGRGWKRRWWSSRLKRGVDESRRTEGRLRVCRGWVRRCSSAGPAAAASTADGTLPGYRSPRKDEGCGLGLSKGRRVVAAADAEVGLGRRGQGMSGPRHTLREKVDHRWRRPRRWSGTTQRMVSEEGTRWRGRGTGRRKEESRTKGSEEHRRAGAEISSCSEDENETRREAEGMGRGGRGRGKRELTCPAPKSDIGRARRKEG